MVLQIQHDLGLIPESAAEAEAHAMTLVRLYKHSLALCKGLDPKEKAPGDDLIPLAVASFMAARNLDTVQSRDAASAAAHDRLVQKHMMQVTLKTLNSNATQTQVFVSAWLAQQGSFSIALRASWGRVLLSIDLRFSMSKAVGMLYDKECQAVY